MTKEEIQQEYQQLVNETEAEIERLVYKKFEKTKLLQEKLKELESKNPASEKPEPDFPVSEKTPLEKPAEETQTKKNPK